MARAANDPANRAAAEIGPHHEAGVGGDHAGDAGTDTTTRCPVAWCPICLTVTTVQPLKPDLMEHLLKAGTEMLLALKAVVDARADDLTAGEQEGAARKSRLEKIELD